MTSLVCVGRVAPLSEGNEYGNRFVHIASGSFLWGLAKVSGVFLSICTEVSRHVELPLQIMNARRGRDRWHGSSFAPDRRFWARRQPVHTLVSKLGFNYETGLS